MLASNLGQYHVSGSAALDGAPLDLDDVEREIDQDSERNCWPRESRLNLSARMCHTVEGNFIEMDTVTVWN